MLTIGPMLLFGACVYDYKQVYLIWFNSHFCDSSLVVPQNQHGDMEGRATFLK